MSARNRELFGLIPASLLVTGGFTAVLLTRVTNVHDVTLTYGAIFLGCCVFAHLFIRWRLPNADPYLFPIVAALASVGLVELYRIQESYAIKQAGWFALGLVFFCGTIVFLRDYRVLERYRYTIAAGSIALLLLPRLVGQATNGAYLSIHIGSFSFQPAEFAKIGVIIFLASYLRDVREVLVQGRLPRISLKHMGPLLMIWGASMVMLIFIRDLGSSLMFFGGFLALLYVATGRLSLVLAGLVMFMAGASFLADHISHVHSRVEIWQDPFRSSLVEGKGYQIAQGLFAQADGGLLGKGFSQSLLYLPDGHSILPAPHTDLIYAVIVNELGLFGAAALLLAYLLFARRGFKAAMISGDGFGKLLATGLTAVFALQVFVIVGGVTKVIPLTGVTLPFISYGGSSIIANSVLVALLLIVSDAARQRQELTGGVVS
ncbi:MAG TPA: FtsW/RodA/SpoVE family cell cycle protein [Thermoleophilaceae bacterium]|jgi:cell division protein FtsW (lipid II flippase)|nr:FtsW/RodA/SpoVE family cell cycle protein [Thermoleophilaceae bacterium]